MAWFLLLWDLAGALSPTASVGAWDSVLYMSRCQPDGYVLPLRLALAHLLQQDCCRACKMFLSRQVHIEGKESIMEQPQVLTDPGATELPKPCP